MRFYIEIRFNVPSSYAKEIDNQFLLETNPKSLDQIHSLDEAIDVYEYLVKREKRLIKKGLIKKGLTEGRYNSITLLSSSGDIIDEWKGGFYGKKVQHKT